MVDLMIRRREMVQPSGGQSDLLYSLYNETVEAGYILDTGVAVLAQGLATTIVYDVTTTSNPNAAGQPGYIHKLFLVEGGGGTRAYGIGKQTRSTSKELLWWMASSNTDYTELSNMPTTAGRKRFVLTHEANSNTVTVYYKSGTGSVYTTSKTATFSTSSKSFVIGGYVGQTNHGIPNGTITKLEIYNRIWTADERTAFFA